MDRSHTQVARVPVKSPVVISSHQYDFGAQRQIAEHRFDGRSFFLARSRRMDQIAQDNQALGPQLVHHFYQSRMRL
jgi:hypothetical protein